MNKIPSAMVIRMSTRQLTPPPPEGAWPEPFSDPRGDGGGFGGD